MLVLKVLPFDHPGHALAMLLSRNSPSLDIAEDGHGAQLKHAGGFSQRDFATLGPLAIAINRNTMRIAEGAHPRLRPSILTARSLPHSVEQTGNRLVGHQTGTATDQVNNVWFGSPTCLASSVLLHREPGMITALPM